MQEEGQPQTVELVRRLRVEERQEATYIVHAVHLWRVAGQCLQWLRDGGGNMFSRPT
jgi:hypothetical protein